MNMASFGRKDGNTQFLNVANSEKLQRLQTYTHLHALMGKPDDHPSVKGQKAALQDRIVEAAKKNQRLAGDQTQTRAMLHIIGQGQAKELSVEIRRHAEMFAKKADDLMNDGKSIVDTVLGADNYDRDVAGEIAQYIARRTQTPEGMAEVGALYKSRSDVASVIYTRPHFLLGVSEELHRTMVATAVSKFAPEGAALLNEGRSLGEKTKNFEKVVSDAHASFYDGEVVAKAEASRVEV